ncbi:MAG TPA: DnaA/Hda family protein, partial [Chloroflexota bacterium]|nr:DnaA/Hda family protein [Chloroflexota bacterium]
MNAKQIWQAALGEMQVQMSRPNFETWLRQAAAVSVDESHFVLRAHSTFAAEYLERRLRPQIEQTLSHVIGRPIELEVIVGHSPRGGAPPPSGEVRESNLWQEPTAAAPAPTIARTPRSAATSVAVRETPAPPPLPPARPAELTSPIFAGWQPNPNYTFETFTVGKSNQAAHAAAMSVAEDPGRGYNPLFIYGGVGLGKTHLLHAIANVVVRSGSRTLYVAAEDFTNDLVNAIREHRTDDFRMRYRTIEVLLVDDVQF